MSGDLDLGCTCHDMHNADGFWKDNFERSCSNPFLSCGNNNFVDIPSELNRCEKLNRCETFSSSPCLQSAYTDAIHTSGNASEHVNYSDHFFSEGRKRWNCETYYTWNEGLNGDRNYGSELPSENCACISYPGQGSTGNRFTDDPSEIFDKNQYQYNVDDLLLYPCTCETSYVNQLRDYQANQDSTKGGAIYSCDSNGNLGNKFANRSIYDYGLVSEYIWSIN